MAGTGTRTWRFRAYFVLMDVLTVVVLLLLAQTIAGPVMQGPGFVGDGWHLALGLIAFVLPAFLMLARFMRDEFAEYCWQRAATTTVTLVFFAPILLLLALALLRATGVGDFGIAAAIRGADGAQMLAAVLTMIIALFTFAFQFHRLRGPR